MEDLEQNIYNDLKTYNDHTVEQLKEGLKDAYIVLEILPTHTTALSYIKAVERHLKEVGAITVH